jgi:exopolysaccharide biosynthesis protein
MLREGRILRSYSAEKMRAAFSIERHPRTAVGFTRDGRWVLVVVDGRQPGLSIGVSLGELAILMQSLGCIDALNLDGGGSSNLYFDKAVRNAPSDRRERPVTDTILVLPH